MESEKLAAEIRTALGKFNDDTKPVAACAEAVVAALEQFEEWCSIDECPWTQNGFCPDFDEMKAHYFEDVEPDDQGEFCPTDVCELDCGGRCFCQLYLKQFWDAYNQKVNGE